MKILFVCKHNRFRSKVAESIFKKLNKNKTINAESGGIFLDEERPYIAKNVINIMKDKGYSIKGKPVKIDLNETNQYNRIIIVANNVDKEFFISSGFRGTIVKWEISDCDESDLYSINKIIKDIELKVMELIKELR